ncbi:Dyp-type peroxidase [Paremcibacter congregatus]|uniref:Dyp-type peroxidase n=1 Tax=Paremcibacter congregatus TaxID=2043170 RepID=UPI0030EE963C|tara:strand:- start:9669 stop:11153 length:1485 start_codon:yes stop_codon:yes gene_type:complete
MGKMLKLADIQGNIVQAYRFPLARYIMFQVTEEGKAREFIKKIIPHITTGEMWEKGGKPEVTTNIAFSYQGLKAIGLNESSLRQFPLAFAEGMKARAHLLGDEGESGPHQWDECWQEHVDILLTINARTVSDLNSLTEITESEKAHLNDFHEALKSLCDSTGGIKVLGQQDANVLFYNGKPCAKEHFGFDDGIGNPSFSGTDLATMKIPGKGKQLADGSWVPLAAGEFILGHADESQAIPEAPRPRLLTDNGTYMVYRKLHQNVASFRKYLVDTGKEYAKTLDMSKYRHADGTAAKGWEILAAKMAGRWLDGTPVELSPYGQDPSIRADSARNNDFNYTGDKDAATCPFGAHVRRTNPRGSLGFDGKLTSRRRILRRGLPYGTPTPFDKLGRDQDEHGIIFMAINASIERQFEFVQQLWINYGNDFYQSNDKDILTGANDGTDQAVIQNDPEGEKPPFICRNIPRFVTVRGGEYFFIPSMTALKLLSEKAVSTI